MCFCIFSEILDYATSRDTSWWSAFGTCVGGAGAIAAVFIARKQLIKLNETQISSNVATLLQIEIELSNRKKDWDRAIQELREKRPNLQSMKKTQRLEAVELLQSKMNIAAENYMNIFDRLSSLILKGYFLEIDWKADYHEMLSDTLETMMDSESLGRNYVESKYGNMVKLDNLWKGH